MKDEARVARETEQPVPGTHKASSRIFSTSQFRHHLVVKGESEGSLLNCLGGPNFFVMSSGV